MDQYTSQKRLGLTLLIGGATIAALGFSTGNTVDPATGETQGSGGNFIGYTGLAISLTGFIIREVADGKIRAAGWELEQAGASLKLIRKF